MTGAISRKTLQSITQAIEKLYPLKYANHTWDNTGLLVDSSTDVESDTPPSVMLTVDLTESVANEAIESNCNIIIAYHPFLFKKFNQITPQENGQHRSLIKLIRNNISVYSPHTAVDAAKGGVNDWLAHGLGDVEKVEVIEKDSSGDAGVGMGRVVTLRDSVPLMDVVKNIKQSLGLEYVQLVTPDSNTLVKTVALCAGSGSGVFSSLKEKVDLFYTGELSHHEQLAILANGQSVVLCGHCNTERGFLQQMASDLKKDGVKVTVSQSDKCPFIIT